MRRIVVVALVLFVALSAFAAGKVVKKGEAIAADAKVTPLADVLAKPGDYTKTPVVVEGTVSSVCSEMGCWMELKPANAKTGMHITFKDGAFFVPTDSKGMSARVTGMTADKAPSHHEGAEHHEHEGASCSGEEHAKTTSVAFVATGVELTKQ